MMSVSFTYPQFLVLLVVAPVITAGLWYAAVRAYQRSRDLYGESRLVDNYSGKFRLRSEIFTLSAWLAVAVLLSLSAAGPVMQGAPERAQSGSLDVVVAVDVSTSMGAEDYKDSIPADVLDNFVSGHGSRLDEAKYLILKEIMPAVQDNKLGLVTYRGEGFPQAELTDDFSALTFVLENWLVIGNAPGGGSDYARGLEQAVKILERDSNPNKSKVIVLFSDGGFTGNQAHLSKIEKLLADKNIRLVIVGIGQGQPVPIPQYDNNDQFVENYKVDGKTELTSIDEGPLMELANATGGTYIQAKPGDGLGINWPTALAGPGKVTAPSMKVYPYLLSLAMLLIALLSFKGRIRQTAQRLAGRDWSSRRSQS